MHFFVDKKSFYESLNHFQSIVEKRNTIPILANIKISAKDNNVEITATDLSIQLSEKINAKISEDGELTLPSQILFDIIKKIPDRNSIEIKSNKDTGKVFILFGKSKFSLSSLPANDFPEIDSENLAIKMMLSSDDLKYLLDECKFSMGSDESRQYLNGIYFHKEDKKVITVATDGHRLSKCEIYIDESIPDFDGIIIPKKTVNEISKLLEDKEDSINIELSKTKIKFDFGNLNLISKLVNSNFPDYVSVIPKANNLEMQCDSNCFYETIDRVSTISNEKFRTVKLEISENTCTVSSFGEENSIGTEQISVRYEGTKININFNARYIMDVLSILKNQDLSISFAEDTAPTIIRSKSKPNSLYLIMQMRA